MINILTGRPGQGKTYVLARKAYDFLHKGVQVYSNIKLAYEGDNLSYWHDPEQLTDLKNGIIIMDEAHVYFNSREWQDMSKDTQRKLQQHRKDGLHIWGTVQHEARIDVVFRELVSGFYLCSKILGSSEDSKRIFGLIRVAQFFPEDMKSKNKVENFVEWFFIRKKYVEFYDTLAKIEPPKKSGLKHTLEFCEVCGYEKIKHI